MIIVSPVPKNVFGKADKGQTKFHHGAGENADHCGKKINSQTV
jgi:hypothetical protein